MRRCLPALLAGAFLCASLLPAMAGQEVTLVDEQGHNTHENYSYTQAGAAITTDGALPAPASGQRRGIQASCPGSGGTMILTLASGTLPWAVVTGTQDRGVAVLSVTSIPAGCSVQALY